MSKRTTAGHVEFKRACEPAAQGAFASSSKRARGDVARSLPPIHFGRYLR